MTNTLTQRVADDANQKIESIAFDVAIELENSLFDIIKIHDGINGKFLWARYDAVKIIQKELTKAIEASGAQHLQGLVDTLKIISFAKYNGLDVSDCSELADKTLAALPPEFRGER